MNRPPFLVQLSPEKPKKIKQLQVLIAKKEEKYIIQSKSIPPVIQTCVCLIKTNFQLMEKTITQENKSLQLTILTNRKCYQLGLRAPVDETGYRGGYFYAELYEACLKQDSLEVDQEIQMLRICRQNEWLRKGIYEASLYLRRGEFLIQTLKVLKETLSKNEELNNRLKALEAKYDQQSRTGKDKLYVETKQPLQ